MSKLKAAKILQPLSELANAKLEKLEVFSSIASSNTYLLSQPAPACGCYRVAVADHQTSGRGRHNRRWLSAPGDGVCLSVAFTFNRSIEQLAGLTLAIGTGVVSALRQLGFDEVSLKWPNDIVATDSKLGGILTEVQSGTRVGATVVAGVGINVHLRDQAGLASNSAWANAATDLQSLNSDYPEREFLAGTLIDHLYRTFSKFDQQGLAAFAEDWRQHDWLRGRQITVEQPDGQLSGIAAGIDIDGALLVDSDSDRVRVISGSIVSAGGRLSS